MSKQESFADTDVDAARRYDRWYESPQGHRMAGIEVALLMELAGSFQSADSLLDVGCGTGYFTRSFAGRGLSVVGLDPSPAMLAVATDRGGGPIYTRGWAESLPFTDNSFDLVAFVTSLEFVADPSAALREARRVGRFGLIIGALNAFSPLGLRRKLHSRFRPSYYSAAHFYTPWSLRKVVRQELGDDVRIVTLRTVLWPGWVPAALRRLPLGAFIGAAVAFSPAEDRGIPG